MVNFMLSGFHLNNGYTCEVLKILRNKISITVLLATFQFCIGREVERIINNVIIGMILGSIDESLKRHKLWKDKFQVSQ